MTISYVGAASASAESLTLPSHQDGDLLLLWVYRNNSVTSPTIVNNWLVELEGSGGTNRLALFWRIANSSAVVSGTWTSATQIACTVYRPASGYTLAVTQSVTAGATSVGIGGNIVYSALAPNSTPADSWFVAAAGHRSNNTDIETAPSGMTVRTSTAGGAAGELAAFDTAGSLSSWQLTNYTLTAGTSSGYRSIVAQIASMSVASVSAGGGSLINSQQLVRQGWIG
jgi:hypothetical protein